MAHIPSQATKQKGFTIVELLLALAVFSFVLVFVTTAFLQLFRTYNRGITRKDVNQSTRLLIDDIASKMRIVADPSLIDYSMVSNGRLCVGSYSYVWNTIGQTANLISVNGQQINMVRIDNDTGRLACQKPPAGPTQYSFTGQATSMFTERIGIQSFTVTPQVGGISGLFNVSITANTNQTNLLDSVTHACIASNITSAYCSNVTLQETIGLRNR
ncbi:MAG TPA: prepilin-type N-terminal cleavage/methylation domain-containing protein [Candidatus Saccharimonadales bacterium]|nr:prepilin-type N-terminal cleavage/methylation domain-containing protein [Candidatus Saccharimonadales bacterium]